MIRLFDRKITIALLVIALGGVAGASCAMKDPPPKTIVTCDDWDPIEKPRERFECQRQEKARSARDKLGNFKGDVAWTLFADLETLETQLQNLGDTSITHCESAYGKVLADLQETVQILNNLVLNLAGGLVETALAAPPARGAPWVRLAYEIEPLFETVLGDAQDWGENIANIGDLISKPLMDLAKNSAVVESIRGCEFSMMGTSTVDYVGDPEETARLTAELGHLPYLPLRLLTNDSLDTLDAKDLAVEIRLGDKFDAVEARAFGGVANLVVAFFNFLSAHSMIASLDVGQLTGAVGIDLRALVECTTDPNSYSGKPPRATSSDANNNNILDSAEECIDDTLAVSFYLPQIIRSLGFLFGDQDGFLDRSEKRWDKYFPSVDNYWATGSEEFRLIFDSMVARISHIEGSESEIDDELERYFLLYKDRNSDSKVGGGDQIGLNIKDMGLKIPGALLDTLGMTESDLEEVVRIVLSLLKFEIPNDKVIDDATNVMEKTRDALLAVDDPTIEYESIEVADLQGLVQVSGLFGPEPMPNVLALDLKSFFVNPRPLRDFLPYWEAVSDKNATFRNELIIETEGTSRYFQENARLFPLYNQEGDVVGSSLKHWEIVGDQPHFMGPSEMDSLYSDPPKTYKAYYRFVPSLFTRVQYPMDNYVLKIADYTTVAKKDCIGPLDSSEFLGSLDLVMYAYMKDPSFNGALLTNMGAIKAANHKNWDDPACFGAAAGDEFVAADLWSFHRAVFTFWDWFIRTNTLTSLLGGLGG